MTTVITRRLNFKKYWCTTNAVETGFKSVFSPKWSNTFYIHFCKDDFPKLNYPAYFDGRFDYMNENDIASLPFHKGITFYEETAHRESGKTYVKAGCDFQHLHDDIYWQDDNGEMILKNLSKEVGEAFDRLVEKTIQQGSKMTPDNKIMDYIVGLEKNLLKVKEENEQLKSNLKIVVEALKHVAMDKIWPLIEAKKALSKIGEL